jgi:uncharacterized repeat protein (TIGR02543 family)
MPNVYVKKSTGWSEVKSIYVKKSTGWIEILNAYVKKSTGWIKVFQRTQIPGITTTPKVRNFNGDDINNTTHIARVGNTLYGYRGVWTNDPTSYEDRWYFSTISGGIFGPFSPSQINTTLPMILGYDDYYIVYQVRATNAAGTSDWVSSSNQARVVRYKPVSIAAPEFNTIAAAVGNTITALGTGSSYWQSTTSVTNDTAPDPSDYPYQYLWTYFPSGGTPGAANTSSTYTPVSADIGNRLQVTVTASNSGGSTQATSSPTLTISNVPVVNVSPTISKPGYTGTSAITVGATLRGNTGTYTPDPDTVFWGFQYASSASATTGTFISGGQDTSENQNKDILVPSTVSSVSMIGKYIRFYSIPRTGGATGDTYNTEWIGPVYAAPTAASNLDIAFVSGSSSTQVNVRAFWTNATSASSYTVQYNNGTSWIDLHNSTTGALANNFLAPVGTFNYRVRSQNGDGVYAFSPSVSVTLTAQYTFSYGSVLYPNTNGWIGIDSFHNGTAVPSTGRFFAIFPLDMITNSMFVWSSGGGTTGSDSNKYVIRFDGYRFGFDGQAAYRVTWMATFYTNQSYVDVKIIRKGSSVSGLVTVGLYDNGVLVGGLPGPYSIAEGTTFRINYGGGTNSFGIAYDEISATAPNNIMVQLGGVTQGSQDDGSWTITTAASTYNTPILTRGSSENRSTTISIPFTESGGMDGVSFIIRSTSHSGTELVNTSTLTSPIALSTLSSNTDYYLTYTPFNYKNQAGAQTQIVTRTAPAVPTVTFSNVSKTSFQMDWSSTGASSYDVNVYNATTAVSLTGYPLNNTTTTSATITGLSAGTNYGVEVWARNSGGLSFGNFTSRRTLFTELIPTFGTDTRNTDGFSSSVNNYDSNYSFTLSTNSGTVTPTSFSGTGTSKAFTVSGLTAGSSATVTVQTTRTDYASGSATRTNSALPETYSVTYNANGATSGTAPASQTKTKDETLVLRTNTGSLARTGFTFDGWYTNSSGTGGTAYAAGANYTGNAALSLFAKWNEVVVVAPGAPTSVVAARNYTTALTSNATGSQKTQTWQAAIRITWTAPTPAPSGAYEIFYNSTGTAPAASATPDFTSATTSFDWIPVTNGLWHMFVRSSNGAGTANKSAWVAAGSVNFVEPGTSFVIRITRTGTSTSTTGVAARSTWKSGSYLYTGVNTGFTHFPTAIWTYGTVVVTATGASV